MQLLVFLFGTAGVYLMVTAQFPGVYRPAVTALRKRAPRPISQSDLIINRIAAQLQRYIDMDPIKEMRLAETLKSLGHSESPVVYQSRALAKALLLSGALCWLCFLSVFLGVLIMSVTCVSLYSAQSKKLQREMEARRQRIERELPQFASTIRQSLNSTHDVVAILSTYRTVCGPVLRSEIDRTLNDMVTGNPERAIKALESRVSSAKLSQLTRGLIAVLRGDDQRIYFDMLSSEYRKAQNEEVAKALLKRPEQLTPYMGLLFICLVLMICAALGTYLAQQMGTFF